MKKRYSSFFEDDIEKLEEMSNLTYPSTGIPGYTIWISSKSGREKHWARVKVSNSDGEVVISLEDDPEIKGKKGKINISSRDMKMIKKFISLNKNALMNHWLGITDSRQFGNEIKPIK